MRLAVMIYGAVCYTSFFAVFLYFIGFVGDFYVPKGLSSGTAGNSETALVINLGLILLWGVQHSVMARSWFKEAIASVIPHQVERSTYVLISAIILAILMYFWQPMGPVIWQINSLFGQKLIWGLFAFGWVLVLIATFLTDHFDLFGLRQSWLYFVGKSYSPVKFTERYFYRLIRHPMMLGLLIAFWIVPVMTMGHLVFSIGMTIYILVGIYFEERWLAKHIGTDYQDYQKRTKKIIPGMY